MDNNTEKQAMTLMQTFVRVIKIIFALPFFIAFFGAAIVTAFDFVRLISEFSKENIFPAAFIMMRLSTVLFIFVLAVVFVKPIFPKKMEKVGYGRLFGVLAVFTVAFAVFGMIDDEARLGWRWAEYPPYIEGYERQILYSTQPCDYSETVHFSAYLPFVQNGFRENKAIEILEDATLTDRYRIEVYCKGEKAEMNIYSDTAQENLYVHTVDYDYELTPKDYVYMYKHKINLEYSTPLAIEKIIIRTAYPDKIDVSGIEC